MFNGKDLTNWTFSEKSLASDRFVLPPNAVKWRVEDGAITFTGKDTSYLTAAGGALENFHLRMELRTSPGARVRLGPIDTTHISIDNTRPDIGFPVMRVVVPGLRHFWARFAPGRLYDVPVALGWLDRAQKEETLNSKPFFI